MKHSKFSLACLVLNSLVGAAHGTGIDHAAKTAGPLGADVKKDAPGAAPDITLLNAGQSPQMEQGTAGAVNQIGNDESKLMNHVQGIGDGTIAGMNLQQQGLGKTADKQPGADESSVAQLQQGVDDKDAGANDQPGGDEVALKQADDAGTGASGTFA